MADTAGTGYTWQVAATDHLSAEQLAWLVEDEKLWRRAHDIAAHNPGVDPGGVYRVLRNLKKPPGERLRAALEHGRQFFRVHPG
jgi:hypothetical protein